MSSRPSSIVPRSEEDEMRAALQVTIAQICTSENGNDGAHMTKSAITTLTELAYLYATTSLANDLEAFSQHAGRRTITPEDVQLVARKNPDNLLAKLQEFAASSSLITTTITTSTTAASNNVTSSAAIVPTKKKVTTPKKKKKMLPKSKKQSPKNSQRSSKELRERLLRRMDTDTEDSSSEQDEPPAPALKSVWDFSASDDSLDNKKGNRKPAVVPEKRKRANVLNLSSSSSEDDDPPISQFKKAQEFSAKPNGTKAMNDIVDLSKSTNWSSEEEEFM